VLLPISLFNVTRPAAALALVFSRPNLDKSKIWLDRVKHSTVLSVKELSECHTRLQFGFVMAWKVLGFVLSLVVSNWIYSEAVLIYPDVERAVRDFFAVVRIPTHNEWPAIASSPDAAKLRADMSKALGLKAGASALPTRGSVRANSQTGLIDLFDNSFAGDMIRSSARFFFASVGELFAVGYEPIRFARRSESSRRSESYNRPM
jgi:hypothetical protein